MESETKLRPDTSSNITRVPCNADMFRYKGLGSTKVEGGAPDRVEFFSISQDDILSEQPAHSSPAFIEKKRNFLASYTRKVYSVVALILSELEKHLDLPSGTLAALQPQNKASGTSLRLLHYPPQATNDRRTSLLGHTDIGTITILFNVLGGLQILTPDADPSVDTSWQWVKPQPGCAIVNLGDAMVEWSGGILRSNMHRVTFPPGEQAEHSRYSVAYLVRAAGDVSMERLTGGRVIPALAEGEEELRHSAREWEAMKVAAIVNGRDNARSRGGRRIEIAV